MRGKAGAEVKFGNGLYLAEQADGLIVDWDFMQDQPPSDSKLVKSSIERVTGSYGKPDSYTDDRGFDSASARTDLEELGIINAICPRSVPLLKEKLEDEDFCLLQKQRGYFYYFISHRTHCPPNPLYYTTIYTYIPKLVII
ncbi:hypothetical protein [Pontiella sulfatireligans]|uniref:Transposase IS4-like domain-containing protein n=1 Tax=Pontiella sulfatireligans TaxID=2750658 RepID=A0A6C2UMW3_9BACT|nr:hypothetical protein [Pontiella sulfatireligans]VGO21622.1 hypothetical protein SCARR_03696 [Pontiella sulfatireligans]